MGVLTNEVGAIRFAGTNAPIQNTGWSAWTTIANGVGTDAPAVTSTFGGQGSFPIQVVVRGTDGNVWETPFNSNGFTSWSLVGNQGLWGVYGTSLSAWATGCQGSTTPTYNLAIATNGVLAINRKSNNVWSGCVGIRGGVSSAPGISAYACGTYDIVVQVANDGAYWWDGYQ
ncbi:MAG: hypothetical protein ACOY0T_33525 [Myxococcota bacterium]